MNTSYMDGMGWPQRKHKITNTYIIMDIIFKTRHKVSSNILTPCSYIVLTQFSNRIFNQNFLDLSSVFIKIGEWLNKFFHLYSSICVYSLADQLGEFKRSFHNPLSLMLLALMEGWRTFEVLNHLRHQLVWLTHTKQRWIKIMRI
jgi:hypothetical protein